MGNPVVHFEIIGTDPARLRRYYGELFGCAGHQSHVVFYVGVPDVAAALAEAERLGGKRRMGPDRAPGRDLVVAHFTDVEGNLIGLAGPA
jgi:predicted enzyme related to lactoylglutathione lyase